MATEVCRIEIGDGVPNIRMSDGHSRLMALVTYRGVPLGDITIDIPGGIIRSRYLSQEIAERFSGRILQLWLKSLNGHNAPKASASIDVIVCTSDRPDDLRRCLQSLANTSYPRKSAIVVDNGSRCDVTYDIALEYGAHYVREQRRGLDFARNAGIGASDAEFLAFADDDVVVDPMWLDNIIQAFQSDPAIACVTGLTMPLELETEAQEMFERYSSGGMRRGYERRVFDRSNLLPAAAGRVGAGANMAFRSSVLKQIGGFDEALDCGTPAKAGGDTDMFYRSLRHGYKICYEPRALAWHRHRRGMDELQNQLGGYSLAVYAFLTKCLIEYGDLNALVVGYLWFKSHHLKSLAKHIRGRATMPRSFTAAELIGVLSGPAAYLRSKSYVSHIRLQQGQERRGKPNRGAMANLEHIRLAGSILARLVGRAGGRKSA